MLKVQQGNPDLKDELTRQQRGLCADCDAYVDCLFHMPRYGGFRNQGERYVLYRLTTDPAENQNTKEDFCSCRTFVRGGLQDRMLTGREQRARGLAGEVVTVITDRRWITQGTEMGFNTRNEIINPIPNLVDDLRTAGYKVNLNDQSQAVIFK